MAWQNAIFAPGWVWSMLSMVLVVGTLVGLYRQLRLQSAQGAREQLETLDREWNTERFDRCKLEVLLVLRDSKDATAVPRAAATAIATYWERIAALTDGGHIDLKLLHSFNGGACPVWWVALAPFIRKLRAQNADPAEYLGFARLAESMAVLDRQTGASAFDEELLRSQLDDRIATYHDRIRLEESLRSATRPAAAAL